MSSGRKYLTLDEIAERYGVHPRTIRRRISAGQLPAYQLRGSTNVIRIKIEDADKLFERIPTAGSAS